MLNEQQKLQQLIEINQEISRIQDIDVLLERILSAARELVNADAGTIYIKHDMTLRFSHAQNDTLQKRLPPGEKLIYKTFTAPINHRSISGHVASTAETLNISDVYQLPHNSVPYAFDQSYDAMTMYRTQSMLTLPLKNNQGQVLGVMQLINAQDEHGHVVPFPENDLPIVRIFGNNAALSIERTQHTRSEILGLIQVLTEFRDQEETEAHVNRVGAYSAEIYRVWAHRQGIPIEKIEATAETLRMGAMLHDLGKLAIPTSVRSNPGKFSVAEYDVMKQHTVKGSQMLLKSAQTEYERVAAEIALNHHEYWNGKGYPGQIDVETGQVLPGYENGNGKARGKRGTEIPLMGRVVAIADTYDALLSRRAFRRALKEEDVLRTLKSGAGTHFDPELIDAFFTCLGTLHAIAQRFPEAE